MFPYRFARSSALAALFLAASAVSNAQIEELAAQLPGASTLAPTLITETSARIRGQVTPNGARTDVRFDFGPTTAYGTEVAATPSSIGRNAGTTTVRADVTGLRCGSTYHYRVRASNRKGSSVSADAVFNTLDCAPPPASVAPTAATAAATQVVANGATLNGSATAGSASASLSFDYGTTTAYGSTTAAAPASLAADGSSGMSATLSGLACATTYHFRARATSTVGTATGANASFTTAACTAPPPPTACSSTAVHCVSAVAGSNQEFATIQAAVNAAVAGDTVLVFDGNYAGFVVSRSGTASAPITVKANGANVVVDRPSSAGEGIRVSNAHHVVIEGFTVTGISGYGLAARGATATSPMQGVVFRDNTVRNSGSGSGAAIYASQVANSLIEGNTASDSPIGIYLANAGSKNTTLRGNLLFNNSTSGMHFNGDASVGGDGVQSGLVVEDNVVHGNLENGLNMDGVQASTIRNNLVYNNGRHGIRGFRIDAAAGPRDLVIVNNTIVVKGGNTAVKLTEDGGGHTVFNNALANEGTSGGTIVLGTATGTRSDYNTFVNPGFSVNGGSTMLSLTQWRSQAGAYDGASRTSTLAELFVAPASRDYRLRAGAAAANAGVAQFNGKAAPADDVAGVARPQGGSHDHGAYENF